MRVLVTGAAGFIGSHLVYSFLRSGHTVVGVDNFSNRTWDNLDWIKFTVPDRRQNFIFIPGDITNLNICEQAMKGVDYVFHHAALSSILKSFEQPLVAHHDNVTGFVKVLQCAKKAGVKRVIYASSSAVYGNCYAGPVAETAELTGISPYAVTKRVNELYAQMFQECYGLSCVGLRYFNVYGPRQLNDSVISQWVRLMRRKEMVVMHADGCQVRDFVHVNDVVEANISAAISPLHQPVYNIGSGTPTTLHDVWSALKEAFPDAPGRVFQDRRQGDIAYSCADIALAKSLLGFKPEFKVINYLRNASQLQE